MIRKTIFYFLLGVFFWPVVVRCEEDEVIKTLLDSLQLVEDKEKKIELLFRLSDAYQYIDFRESLDYAAQSERLSVDAQLMDSYYEALMRQAKLFADANLNDSCTWYLNRIILNKSSIDDYQLLGDVYSLYGKVLSENRDLDGAKIKLRIALRYHDSASYQPGIASDYNRISIIQRSLGQYDSAAYYCIQSLQVSEKLNDTIGMVKSMGTLAKLYLTMDQYPKAKDYLLRGYKLLQHYDHQRFLALITQNLGIVHFKTQQFDSALFYFDQSMEIYIQTNSRINQAYSYGNMGAVYDEMEEYDKALEQFRKAYYIHEELNNLDGIVSEKSNIALSYARRKMYREALLIYDTVLQLATQYEMASSIAHTYDNIYKTYETMGDYKNAFKYQSIFFHFQDSLVNLEKENRIVELELEYGKGKDQAEILMLQNLNLEQELEIKRKTNQRNVFTLAGLALVITILMVFLITRQRMIKDKIIQKKEIDRLNEEKKALAAKSLVEGQEEERKRVATELHDGIGVLLSSVKLQFTNIGDKLPENKEMFEQATNLLEKASGDVRRISHNLMPGNLTRFGLFDALEDLFESINSESLEAEITVDAGEERLPENHEIMIYRMVQEMINNTLKHARASSISLLVNHKKEQLILHFADNGVGFKHEDVPDTGSLGLKSIKSRVDFLEGDLEIKTKPGQGAAFLIRIPTNNRKE